MGVKGLWKLLEPCGRRIHVETLENTTLAVDVSIWMTQFVKAMRDEEGRPIKNAHVIGTLRRVAKLLYHGVRPVIVFDGGVPALKERLIRQRRMRRERREDDARSTAKRLLAARLRAEALRRKLGDEGLCFVGDEYPPNPTTVSTTPPVGLPEAGVVPFFLSV